MELIRAKKSLGQNFLVDNNISRKIVELLDIQSDDIIIEIGPGTGALTQFILNHTMSNSLTYLGIEIDQRAIANLKENFIEFENENINVIKNDFLKFDLFEYINSHCGDTDSDIVDGKVKRNIKRKIKIIGNIPYNISSQIFFKLFELSDYINVSIIMIQRELAQRIIAKNKSKDYGILTVALSICGTSKIELKVPRTCFLPQPNVDSAVLKIKYYERKKADFSKFQKLNRAAFNQRRKMLSNSLKNILTSTSVEFYKKLVRENYKNYFNKRPEQLSTEDFLDLYNHINQELKSFNQKQ